MCVHCTIQNCEGIQWIRCIFTRGESTCPIFLFRLKVHVVRIHVSPHLVDSIVSNTTITITWMTLEPHHEQSDGRVREQIIHPLLGSVRIELESHQFFENLDSFGILVRYLTQNSTYTTPSMKYTHNYYYIKNTNARPTTQTKVWLRAMAQHL